MCNLGTILVLLACAVFAHCADKVKIWSCRDNPMGCELVANVSGININDPNGCVVFESGDWFLEIHAYWNGFGVSNRRLNFGICYSSEFENDIIMDANTNSVIIDKFDWAYLVHICKTVMSFKTPLDTWQTFKRSYENEVVPYLNEFKSNPRKEKQERFCLRALLKYLRNHDSVKGAPFLRGRRRLEEDLNNRFGRLFFLVNIGYENKQFTVSDNEGVFYSLAMGKMQKLLFKYISSIAVNRVQFGEKMFYISNDAIVDSNYGPLVEGTALNSVAMHLYKTTEEALAAQEQGSFTSKEVVKNCDCSDYTIQMAKDSNTGNTVINYKSSEGTADTYVMYNTNAWSFHCAITKYLMVIPEGPNIALYNFASGVGLIISKSTGRAVISKKSSEDIKRCSKINHILEAIEYIVKIAKETSTANILNPYRLNFPNFLTHSYYYGRFDFLMTSVRCKLQLMRYFSDFSKDFRAIKGYEWGMGSDNAVLYFFKNVCVRGVRDDHRNMMGVVATSSSSFFCREVLQGTYSCALENYSM